MSRTIRRILHPLLIALAFCCGMRLWQYYVGVRLAIYDLLLLLFVIVYAIRVFYLRGLPLAIPAMRPVLLLMWGILLVSLLSFFSLDFDLARNATEQFWKGVAQMAFYTIGLSAVVCYLSESGKISGHRVVQAYILGASASCIYSYFEVLSAHYGHDLGKSLFGRVSVYPPGFDWTAPFYYQWDVFFRAVGFTGVNSQATYAASVIPLLVCGRPFRSSLVNVGLATVCFTGTALTFSRTGIVSLVTSFVLYALIRPKWAIRFVPRVAIIVLPAAILGLVFSEGARKMIATRLYSSYEQIGSGRVEIYDSAWESIKGHPFGHGINQFAVVVAHSNEIDLSKVAVEYYMWDDLRVRQAYANVHNNWLNWLFEGGWVLLLAQLSYYLAVIVVCWRPRTELGMAAVCSLAMLLVAGCFNMTLDLFSTSLLFVILPVSVTLDSQVGGNDSSARSLRASGASTI